MPRASSLVRVCICFSLVVAAVEPTRVHEARQGPIQTQSTSLSSLDPGPGPVSRQSSTAASSTFDSETTMPPTSSSKLPLSSPSVFSPSSSSTSSNTPSPDTSPSPYGTSSATPQPSQSPSSPRPSQSSSPSSLTFTVNNMTTCTSGLISWSYGGNHTELLLSVTNVDVDQHHTLSRIKARQSTVNATIQQQLVDTDTSALSWRWSSVNLTQGWYEIQGLAFATPTVSNNSAPFFIANGTDITCLAGTSSEASSTASSGATASHSSAASKSNLSHIVGGVVGTIVGLILVVIAGIWLWSRRRKSSIVGGGSRNRKWGTLTSTNSSFQPEDGGTQLTNKHFHAHSESTTGVLQNVTGSRASATTSSGDTDEPATIVGEEKVPSSVSPPGMSPFDVLSTPVHYDRRASTYYTQTPIAVASEDSRSRSTSLHTANQSIEQQAQRIRSSMEVSIRRRSDRLSMPTLPSPELSRLPRPPMHTQVTEEYPLSPVAPTSVDRSISAGAVSTLAARRASRKPVPYYNPSVVLEGIHTDSASTFTGGAESSSQSHGTGMGAGECGTPTDLVHKASFGDGRPVHYLIPDMPPPQRN